MSNPPPGRRTVLRYGIAALGAPLLAACAQSTQIKVAGVDVTNLDAFTAANIDWRSEQGATLVLGAEQHPWITAMSPYLPQFEKLTGVKVSLQVSGEDQYVAKMPVVLAGGSATPDVYMVWSYGQAVQAGWLEPLDAYLTGMNDPAWYDDRDVFASAHDYVRWQGGTTYGLPITAEAQVTFYRDDVITDPGALSTFEGFQEAAVRAKESGRAPAGVALRGKPTGDAVAWPAAGYVFSHGGHIVDPDGRIALDSPQAVAGVQRYADIVRAACPKGVSTWSWLEITTAMQQARVAMLQDSSNAALDIADPAKSRVAARVKAAPFPAHDGLSKPNLYHWILGISRHSRNKKAAWLFLLWATSRQGAAQIAARGGTPPRASAWENARFREIFGAQRADATLKALRAADSKPVTLAWMHPKWPEIGDAFARAVNSVFTSDTSARSALSDARHRLRGVA